MKNIEINQDVINIVSLMGKQVSFVNNIKIEDKFHSDQIQGQITDIVLSLDGNHQVSVEGGDFFVLSELTEFKILDSDPVADAFEALITDNKDFIDSLSKPTL